MVDKIVELENNKNYAILDETIIDNNKYYFGLRLNDKDEPTNNYLFFSEYKDNNDNADKPPDINPIFGCSLYKFLIFLTVLTLKGHLL